MRRLLNVHPAVPTSGRGRDAPLGPSGFGAGATALFVVAFAFGGTKIVSSMEKVVRTVLLRILLFYIGEIVVISAAVPMGRRG